METNAAFAMLSGLAQGMIYFSESEAPFTVDNWGNIPGNALSQNIAAKYNADPSQLKMLEVNSFLGHLIAKADPTDIPMMENAKKIKAFYEYVKENLSDLRVYRIEGSARIPIIIIGYLADGSCVAIQTKAIET